MFGSLLTQLVLILVEEQQISLCKKLLVNLLQQMTWPRALSFMLSVNMSFTLHWWSIRLLSHQSSPTMRMTKWKMNIVPPFLGSTNLRIKCVQLLRFLNWSLLIILLRSKEQLCFRNSFQQIGMVTAGLEAQPMLLKIVWWASVRKLITKICQPWNKLKEFKLAQLSHLIWSHYFSLNDLLDSL